MVLSDRAKMVFTFYLQRCQSGFEILYQVGRDQEIVNKQIHGIVSHVLARVAKQLFADIG